MTPRIRPRPGARYRVVVTEHADHDRHDDDAEIVFDHTGDQFLRERLTGNFRDRPPTTMVPRQDGTNSVDWTRPDLGSR